MDFRIRSAQLKDHATLIALFEEIDRMHRDALPHKFQKAEGFPRSQEYFAELVTNPEGLMLVADKDERPIGLLVALLRQTPDIPIIVPRRLLVIDTLVVDPKYRYKGIGKALMENAHQWGKEKNVQEVQLNVYEFNQDAILFYKTLGYENLSRRMEYKLD
jgi:ribosomal protein S18 acetylase RimI-like enzyme